MFRERAHESQGPRIAHEVLEALKEWLDDPPSITKLCVAVSARERTLHPSCVEALSPFGELPSSTFARARGG